jgi:hypothetical protein
VIRSPVPRASPPAARREPFNFLDEATLACVVAHVAASCVATWLVGVAFVARRNAIGVRFNYSAAGGGNDLIPCHSLPSEATEVRGGYRTN